MRVEGYFKLFEIESLLRNVCFDTFEPLRERMHKDQEPARRALLLVEKQQQLLNKAMK
jgi:hypothetical protein